MTKDTNKENALKVIRYIQENVEGLKERIDYISNHQALRSETQAYLISITEVQLNHLLLAIPKFAMVNDNERLALVSLQENGGKFDYDLTKTVQENLESNPELTNYLLTLFNL